jgi:limonene-1,2-epoxide hydrolase
MTPLETVRAFLARMEAKDYGEAVKLVAPDCELLVPLDAWRERDTYAPS